MLLSNICRKSATAIALQSTASIASSAGTSNSYLNYDPTSNAFNPACFGMYNETKTTPELLLTSSAFTDFYGNNKQELTPKFTNSTIQNTPKEFISFAIQSAPSQERLFRLIPDENGHMIFSPSGEELAQDFKNSSICWSESSNSQIKLKSKVFDNDSQNNGSSSLLLSSSSSLYNEVLTNLASQNQSSSSLQDITLMANSSTVSSNESTPLMFASTSTIPLLELPVFNAFPVNEIPSFAVPIAPNTNMTGISEGSSFLGRLFGTDDFAEMIREGDGGASQFEEFEKKEKSKLSLDKSNNLHEILTTNGSILKNNQKQENNILKKALQFMFLNPSSA